MARNKTNNLWNRTGDRSGSHYSAHMTEAEYIALKMLGLRTTGPRKVTEVTIRRFSWEKSNED